jgi:hypothetical protein
MCPSNSITSSYRPGISEPRRRVWRFSGRRAIPEAVAAMRNLKRAPPNHSLNSTARRLRLRRLLAAG